MNIKVLAALAAAAVMAASVTACGKKTDDKDTSESKAESSAAEKDTESTPEEDSAAESSEAPTESKPEEEEEKLNYIGEKDAKKADYSVELTNGTEHEIIGFAINYGDGEYSENLIPDGEDFEIDEVRLFNWSHTVSGDVMMLGDFNVEITLDDGQRFELHGFPLTDMLSAEIRLMDEYAFLVYTNKIGDVKDTMKKEADIVEDEKEKEAAKTSTTTEAPIPEPEPETDTEPVTEPEPQPEPQTDTQAENSQAEQPQVTDQQNVDGQPW
ncbi:hypothetical protein [Ruminococcus albus]|uniref:Lipoprotein n=1 Tax=Ruminococcus albus TaxID=1264 RepID=A0A1H7M4U0_RUMAL|nr:hypothetical protein [Ruminococcus albus]SEL05978.1 hypothetical protein SAMN05216469_110119 [Ruminococcus albus]